MAKVDKKVLRERYMKLPRSEKEVIGEALVKVNLGVADPADLRRAAFFLKGSPFIAKKESLDELIQYLHDAKESFGNLKTESLINKDKDLDEKLIQEIEDDFEEDSEVTAKDHVDKIK